QREQQLRRFLPRREIRPGRRLQPHERGLRSGGIRFAPYVELGVEVPDQESDRGEEERPDAVRDLRERHLLEVPTGGCVKADDRHYFLAAGLLADGEAVPFFGAGANLCDRPEEAHWE